MKVYAPQYHFVALETGNLIMAILTISSFFIVKNQIDSRPEAFVRGVYSASFLKLMVCMVSILVYVLLNRSHIHKGTVFVLFGIYAIYTVAETLLLSKLAKE
jgi:Ca2+/Na+ antiporter